MPRRKPLTLLAALLAAVLTLAACQDPSTSGGPPAFELLETAQDVPLVATQGLGLMNRLDDSLTVATASSAGLSMSTLEAVDFDDYPFVNITFTAPGPINDIWEYATTLTPEMWDATSETDSPYGTVITGATTARMPVSLISSDLAILLELHNTLEALGGQARLDAIVAATPTTLLMRDTTGTYWDTSTAQPADELELAAAQGQYADMRARNNTPEVHEELNKHWQQLLNPDTSDLSPSNTVTTSMLELTDQDGALNITNALHTLKLQEVVGGDRVDSIDPVCSRFLWWKICHNVEIGSISDAHQGHDNSGAYQYANAFGRDGTFNMPICITGGTKQDAPVGCGPTAFASLLWRDWVNGETYLGLTYGEDNTNNPPPTTSPPGDEPPTTRPPADQPPTDNPPSQDPPTADPPGERDPWRCLDRPELCMAYPPVITDPVGCIGRPWECTTFTNPVVSRALPATTPQLQGDLYAAGDRYDRSPDGLLAALTQPNSRGVPLISAYMGACYFVSGSMSTPAGFVNGANAFLRDEGKQNANRGTRNRIRLAGNTSYLLGNVLSASAKATMLRNQLGRQDNAMVALYWPKGVLSTAGAHYSLIEQYRITSGGTYLTPDVAIMAVDTPRFHDGRRIWHSLSDIWLPATGVYYLDRY